jgi:biotin synthase-like enzyme
MLLAKAKSLKEAQNAPKEIPYSARPWADIMYQLNIPFNEDPKDDIEDIKKELTLLVRGMDDDELNKEIRDLENYVENLYLNFQQNYSTNIAKNANFDAQLNNLAMINQINLL